MIVKERKLKGAFEIDLEPLEDNRGFFMRTYDEKLFSEYGLNEKWVQENHAYTKKKNTVRGLHFQLQPYSEIKLVRSALGKFYVVFVDLRKDSPTFGKWDSLIISDANKKMLYVPKGFALGNCALKDDDILLYKMSEYYHPESQDVIRWNDSDIGIEWPVTNPILSKRDSEAPSFKEFLKKYGWLEAE